ncbi:MAG: DNA-directed RNA polymerase subunit omega [Clostridiaceae bacterium]|nr:DNA-directed RNA polymerase subunit omega [Clostridiaceae bacterium]
MNDNMINPSIVDLLEKTEDRYSLIVITSKRARQIIDGSEEQVKTNTGKPLTVAINELDQDKISFERKGDLNK